MGNVAHLLNPRTREFATTVERHQQIGRIAHLTAIHEECAAQWQAVAVKSRAIAFSSEYWK